MNVIERLEFDKLKSILSHYIVTETGKRALDALQFFKRDEIEVQYNKVRKVRELLTKGVRWDFSAIPDLSKTLSKARTGALLQPKELFNIALLLQSAEDIFESLINTELSGLFPDPISLRALRNEITRKITPEGEIKDDATPLLKKLRAERRKRREEVLYRMEFLLDKYEREGLLRERIITQRNGRFVLPFLSNVKPRGVVHGFSNTEATIYVEPFETVEIQNRLVKVIEEEREEVERILRELSSKVYQHSELLNEIYDGLGELELLQGKALFMEDFDCVIPEIKNGDRLEIKEGRHPLLVQSKHIKRVVPLNLQLDENTRVLLISGPNAGGKTVVLKTVGLFSLMVKAAIPIPATKVVFPFHRNIYASGFEDQQDIVEGESSFTALLEEIKEILDNAQRGDLVLLDELLASTDPKEGAALAFAILKKLKERGVRVIANTHLTNLKLLVEREEGMMNATMEFDPRTRKPTYRLKMGEIGLSYALDIARRVGIPEDVIEEAEVSITGIEEELKRLKLSLKEKERELQETLENVKKREEELERIKDKIWKETKEKARKLLNEVESKAYELIKEARRELKAERKVKLLKDATKEIKDMKESLGIYGKKAGQLIPGHEYRIKPLGIVGKLIEIKGDRAIVAVGKFRMEVSGESLYEV